MIHWALPILVIEMLLPFGLVAGFLAASGGAIHGTLEHGELFLAAGNATVTGGMVLATARIGPGANGAIQAISAMSVLAVPSYSFWALLASGIVASRVQSRPFAGWGGLVAIVLSLGVSFYFVLVASRGTK